MMNLLQQFLSSNIAENLALALLHSFWQGAIAAAFLVTTLKVIPSGNTQLRYRLGLAALLVVIVCWPATYSILELKGTAQFGAAGTQATNGNPVGIRSELEFADIGLTEHGVAESEGLGHQLTTENAEALAPAKRVDLLKAEGAGQEDNEVVPKAKAGSLKPEPSSTPEVSTFGLGWVVLLWAVGVLVMIARIFAQLTGVAKLKRDSIDIVDPSLNELFAGICQKIGISRKIRFAASPSLVHPGVVGFWRPVVLIPASMLTSTPPDHLEAILAHELAHIRRYDYLVNLFQMVIEAIFFFNPAVWLISHIIRIEREACCDQVGIDTTGRRIRYAQVLLGAIAKNAAPSKTAVPAAFTGFSNHDNSASVERVKRIVDPQHKPHIKIGSVKLFMLLVFVAVGILFIWKATNVSVNTVAKILTPEERIEKMEEIAETHSSKGDLYNENDKVRFSGKVTTIDGKPLPKHPRIMIKSIGSKFSGSTHFGIKKDGTFEHSVQCRDKAFVMVEVDGYAACFSETFLTEPNQVYDDINLVLDYGYDSKIKVVNEQGQPIEGAEFSKHYYYKTRGGWSGYGNTDEVFSGPDGIAIFSGCVDRPIMLDVSANSYQRVEDMELTLKPDEVVEIVLKKGLISSGVVVAKETGEPVAGARFRLVYKETPGHGWHLGSDEYETESDGAGRFVLNQLRDNFKYSYVIEAEGFNRYVLPKVTHGDSNIRIELIPEIQVSGKIIGDISKLGKSYCSSIKKTVPAISYRCDFKEVSSVFNLYEGCYENEYWPVEIKDGVGYFTLTNVIGDELTLRPVGKFEDEKKLTLKLDGKSIDGILIDLDSSGPELNVATRSVVINFNSPEGYPAVNGKSRLWYMTMEVSESGKRAWSGMDIEVVDGVGRVDFPVPAYIRLAKTNELKGYWFEPDPWKTKPENLVREGDTPFEMTYQAEPAGSIFGQVLDDSGNYLRFSELKIVVVDRPEKYREMSDFHNIESAINEGLGHRESETGRFHSAPVPLGATYIVTARNEDTYLVSGEIELTDENPIQEVTLQQLKPKTISGRLLTADRKPAVEVDVKLEMAFDPGGGSRPYSHTSQAQRTDQNGHFSFSGINTHRSLKYYVRVKGIKGMQPLGVSVKPGSDKTFTLEKGTRFTGRVIDDKTGWPVPDVWVYAESKDDKEHLTKHRSSDMPTDKDGNFIFTSLNNETYRIYMSGASIVKSSQSNRNMIKAGKDKNVDYRVNISEWSNLKPRDPSAK